MNGLLDFFSQDAGQQRRAALTDAVTHYVPPELRDRLGLLAQFNPIQGMADSMSSFDVATDRSRSMDERRRGAINSVVEGLLAVAPAAVASRGYMTPAQGVMEGLLGGSPATKQIGDDLGQFWADEAGVLRIGTPEVRGMIGDQMDLTIRASDEGVPAGRIDYSVYDGEPSIQMIETDPAFRRQGVATRLLQDLQSRYPDKEIDWGSLTDEGAKLYKSTIFDEIDQTSGINQILPEIESKYKAAEEAYQKAWQGGDPDQRILDAFYAAEDELALAREMAARPPLKLVRRMLE